MNNPTPSRGWTPAPTGGVRSGADRSSDRGATNEGGRGAVIDLGEGVVRRPPTSVPRIQPRPGAQPPRTGAESPAGTPGEGRSLASRARSATSGETASDAARRVLAARDSVQVRDGTVSREDILSRYRGNRADGASSRGTDSASRTESDRGRSERVIAAPSGGTRGRNNADGAEARITDARRAAAGRTASSDAESLGGKRAPRVVTGDRSAASDRGRERTDVATRPTPGATTKDRRPQPEQRADNRRNFIGAVAAKAGRTDAERIVPGAVGTRGGSPRRPVGGAGPPITTGPGRLGQNGGPNSGHYGNGGNNYNNHGYHHNGFGGHYGHTFWNYWGGYCGYGYAALWWAPFYTYGSCWNSYWYNGGSWRNGFANNWYWYGPFLPYSASIIIDNTPDVVYVQQSPEVIYVDAPAANVGGEAVVPAAQPLAPAPVPQGSLNRAADYYLSVGDRAFREGRFGDAVHYYAKAIEFSPEDGILHLVLADALFATGDYRYAAYALREALAKDPALASNIVDKRSFYADPRQFDQQLAVLERYLEDHFLDDDARLVLAANYLFGGRPFDCLSLLESPFSDTLRVSTAGGLLLDAARAQQDAAPASR